MAYIGKQPGTGVRNRFLYTATAGQTTFTTSDSNLALSYSDALYMDVYLNGVLLDPANDYTATSGTSVVLGSGATAGDILEIVVYDVFSVFNNTIDGNFDVGGNTTLDNNLTVGGDLTVDTNTLHVDSTNNRVGIGTASPAHFIDCRTTGETEQVVANFSSTGDGGDRQRLEIYVDPSTQTTELYGGAGGGSENDTNLAFSTRQGASGRVEAMRIDSDGNLLVKKTTAGSTNIGFEAKSNGFAAATRDDGLPMILNRLTSDGDIVHFRKDNSVVGQIGNVSSNLFIADNANTGLRFDGVGTDNILPCNSAGATRDNAIDLGASTARFNDAFITNGVTTGSDQNEKQQIASLTDAEIAAAKRISNGFKTFKWNDAVIAKGDNARTHTGVIAQEVRTALEAEGLDAGNYAFFMSDTWWETQTEVPAVEADEENGIEAQDAYTRTDTYETAEEAPEGATERTRLGIRYPELLAFIGAATEQRLANIETRLTALEAE